MVQHSVALVQLATPVQSPWIERPYPSPRPGVALDLDALARGHTAARATIYHTFGVIRLIKNHYIKKHTAIHQQTPSSTTSKYVDSLVADLDQVGLVHSITRSLCVPKRPFSVPPVSSDRNKRLFRLFKTPPRGASSAQEGTMLHMTCFR